MFTPITDPSYYCEQKPNPKKVNDRENSTCKRRERSTSISRNPMHSPFLFKVNLITGKYAITAQVKCRQVSIQTVFDVRYTR
jgi:hypothetical protein